MTEIGLLVVWAFGIWQVSQNHITVGVLTAFIAYIGRFYGRLGFDEPHCLGHAKAAAGAKRIFDILDHVSNVPDPVNPVKLGPIEGRIEDEWHWLSLRQPHGDPETSAWTSTRRNDRFGRPQRQWQEHAGEPDLPLL